MFELQQKKTELMIVCDEKTMAYAKYLVQLVGRRDDGDATVGTKDGNVVAAIYTEKQYRDTLAKVISNTHLLFMGRNKTTQEEAKFINLKFNRFGMKYGWQGQRAVMFVDDSVRKEDYDAFVEYAKKYQLEYQKKDFTAKTMVVAGVAVGWLLSPLVAAPLAVCGLVKNTKIKEEIK